MVSGHANRANRPNARLHRPKPASGESPCQLGAIHCTGISSDLHCFCDRDLGRASYANRHSERPSACLKGAKCGLMHRSKAHRYSITSSAMASRWTARRGATRHPGSGRLRLVRAATVRAFV